MYISISALRWAQLLDSAPTQQNGAPDDGLIEQHHFQPSNSNSSSSRKNNGTSIRSGGHAANADYDYGEEEKAQGDTCMISKSSHVTVIRDFACGVAIQDAACGGQSNCKSELGHCKIKDHITYVYTSA